MGDGEDREPAQAHPGRLQADLSSFARIEKIKSASRLHRDGREQPVGHGHHAAASKQNAFHRDASFRCSGAFRSP
jgi:hypothetical protein